jgi:Zn finger protein HypA/HybF involved in hydrogenase expression
MAVSIHHHDDASFYCVKCANHKCEHLIPLLKYDPERQRRNPAEFQLKCPVCGESNLYNDTEVSISAARRVRGFVPAIGFRNVRR